MATNLRKCLTSFLGVKIHPSYPDTTVAATAAVDSGDWVMLGNRMGVALVNEFSDSRVVTSFQNNVWDLPVKVKSIAAAADRVDITDGDIVYFKLGAATVDSLDNQIFVLSGGAAEDGAIRVGEIAELEEATGSASYDVSAVVAATDDAATEIVLPVMIG